MRKFLFTFICMILLTVGLYTIVGIIGYTDSDDKNVLTVYTIEDILYINTDKLTISFETKQDTLIFKDFKSLNNYVEEQTSKL